MIPSIRKNLPELLTHIVDNRGRTCPTSDSGFPLIATNCVRNDHRYPTLENIRYVTAETRTTWFRSHPLPNDIIFVCKGSPGRVALVPDPTPFAIAQDMVALRADESVIDPRFLYYLLKAPSTQESIVNMHVGTMIPHFKKGDFDKLFLDIPSSLATQVAIAEVLSALDDKIAANSSLGTAAFELSKMIFAQQVRVSNCTMLPVLQVATTALGGTPDRSCDNFWGGSIPWVNSGKANERHILSPSEYITEAGLRNSATKLVPSGSTLIAITGTTMGKMARLEIDACVNQSIVAVWADDPGLTAWLHVALLSRKDALLERATGAAQQHVSKKDVDSLLIPVADEPELRHAAAEVMAMLDTSARAERESLDLASLRETLLPPLMSGRLRVKDAEKQVEAVV